MKTKNIFRMLLVAALLMGANNVKADVDLWTETNIGIVCSPSYDNNGTVIEIGKSTFTALKLTSGNQLVIEATPTDDGSEGRWKLNITNPDYRQSLSFSDWHGDSEGKNVKNTDNPSNYDGDNHCFTFTLTTESIDRLTGNNWQGSGLRIENWGLTITRVYLRGATSQTTTTTYNVNLSYDSSKGSVSANPNPAANGTTVTLTIQPNDGYSVGSISVVDDVTNNVISTTNTFMMPDNTVTATVNFVQSEYTITAGHSNVSVSPAGPYHSGDEITLTATPAVDGYEFVRFIVAKEDGSNAVEWYNIQNGKFTMPNCNVIVYAVYQIVKTEETILTPIWENNNGQAVGWNNNLSISTSSNDYNLKTDARAGDIIRIKGTHGEGDWQVTIKDNNWGGVPGNKISVWNEGNYNNGYGEIILDEFTLAKIMRNDNFVLQGDNFTVTQVWWVHNEADDRTPLTLTFRHEEKEITIGDTYTNAIIASDGENNVSGLTYTYSSDNSNIARVDADGTVTGISEGETIIWARFAGDDTYKAASAFYIISVIAPTYHITYTAEVYDEDQTTKLGTVEMEEDEVDYEEGSTVTFYVTPEDGYEIDAVTVTGDDYEVTPTKVSTNTYGTTTYSFTMPNKDVTINVTFKVAIVKYAVETIASPSEGGSITLVGDETRFAEGDPVSFTVTPNAGYQIVTLSVTSNDNNVECSFANGAYSFTMPAAPVTITATFEIRTISVTIGTHGAATFSDAEAVAIPEGLTAFYAKEVDDNMVKLEEIITGFIPANTGVVLRGEPGTYDVQLATSTVSAITGNLLVGVTTVDEYECKSANQYVLTYHEGTGLVFAQTSSAVPAQVQYGQAYLQWTATAGSRLRLSFGESTGISTIEAETTNDGVIYNLRGQRVENPTKGLYIINGKKVVIK